MERFLKTFICRICTNFEKKLSVAQLRKELFYLVDFKKREYYAQIKKVETYNSMYKCGRKKKIAKMLQIHFSHTLFICNCNK